MVVASDSITPKSLACKLPGFEVKDSKFPVSLRFWGSRKFDIGKVGCFNQFEFTKLLFESEERSVGWDAWEISEVEWQQSSLSEHIALRVSKQHQQSKEASASSAVEDEIDMFFFEASFLREDSLPKPKRQVSSEVPEVGQGEQKKKLKPEKQIDEMVDMLLDDGNDEQDLFDGLFDLEGNDDGLADGALRAHKDAVDDPKPAQPRGPQDPTKARAPRTKATDNELVKTALGDR